jgi:Tol biopolymer transport system component
MLSRVAADDPGASAPAAVAAVRGAHPSVSDDGRWVVYAGLPVGEATDDQRSSTVYLRDRIPGPDEPAIRELTVPVDDVRLGDSVRPAISGDGCVVVVVTEVAYDLFRDDDDGDRWDVYRLVLPHCGGTVGDWELVSTVSADDGDTTASDLAVPTETPAVSQSGAVVAYTHRSPVPKSTLVQVSVVDLTVALGDEGRTRVVPGTPLLEPDDEFVRVGQRHPDLSADGRFVVFSSDALSDRPVADWAAGLEPGGPAVAQVYLWDRDLADPGAAVVLVSAVDGVAATAGADRAVISESGQFVAFESPSPELAGDAELPICTPACPTQIYRSDLGAGSLTLVTRVPLPADADPAAAPVVAIDAGGSQATISADGTQVGFVTRSRTLFPTVAGVSAEPDDGDIVVADVDLGTLRRVSLQPDGITPLDATNAHPVLSASGHVVVFDTLSTDFLAAEQVVSATDVAGGRGVAVIGRPAELVAASLDVGTVMVGYAGPEWYVAVRNTGPSTFLPATVVSSDPQFAITGGTCALQIAVVPGDSCTVNVTLTPGAPGPIAATFTVTEAIVGGTSATVALTGSGGVPDLRAAPAGADFAPTLVGATAATVSFDIENVGFQPVAITSVAFGGTNPADFSIVSTSCPESVINPMTSCAVEVAFAPTEAGYRTATLLVGADAGRYTSVVLTGEGRRITALTAGESRIHAGSPVELGGSGFPAGATVTVAWADGKGESVQVLADAAGEFVAQLPTRPSERGGDRTVVAQSGELSARVEVEVVRRRSGTPNGLPSS